MSRVALITGASSGIGLAITRQLHARGIAVIPTSRKLPQNPGPEFAQWVRADITSEADVEGLRDRVGMIVESSGLQILINCAGIAVTGPLEALDASAVAHQLDVNVLGLLRVSNAVLPELRRGGGRIINIGSISGRWTLPFLGAYSASKMALRAISRAQRLELMKWDIPVTLLEVGNVRTALWRETIDQARADLWKDEWQPYRVPVERALGIAESMAGSAGTAEPVCRAVWRIIGSRHPPVSTLVGLDARCRAIFVALMPARGVDALLARLFRLRAAD